MLFRSARAAGVTADVLRDDATLGQIVPILERELGPTGASIRFQYLFADDPEAVEHASHTVLPASFRIEATNEDPRGCRSSRTCSAVPAALSASPAGTCSEGSGPNRRPPPRSWSARTRASDRIRAGP